jgi:protein-S-isoprenylcysteine O-methyltransferase Ste14
MEAENKNSVGLKARTFAFLGSAMFLLIAPGTVAGYIPWRIGGWRVHASFFGFAILCVAGMVLAAAGLALLLESFLQFALKGIGTPAPVFPPRRLVVSGSYRYVRNPMYVAVVSLILGQGLIFGDIGIFVYGICVWLIMHIFILIYEEPTLRRTFAAEFAKFSANVPRWIPRLTPWSEQH